jgi:hypothetical protein
MKRFEHRSPFDKVCERSLRGVDGRGSAGGGPGRARGREHSRAGAATAPNTAPAAGGPAAAARAQLLRRVHPTAPCS